MHKNIIRMIGFATVLPLSAMASAADLQVSVDGVRNDQGDIRIAVIGEKGRKDFPDAAGAAVRTIIAARKGRVTAAFHDLPPGKYAIAVFHDENGNGALDSNLFGIPTEGYGFSGKVKGFMGPPSFDGASIDVGTDGMKVLIPLNY